MEIKKITSILGWCIILNVALLLWWALWMLFAHDLVYNVQSAVLDISVEQMDVIHYGAMAFHKILIIVFNVIPYLALKIIK
jgi:TRAP-type C4-dicarboxylate transport system permease small subunit